MLSRGHKVVATKKVSSPKPPPVERTSITARVKTDLFYGDGEWDKVTIELTVCREYGEGVVEPEKDLADLLARSILDTTEAVKSTHPHRVFEDTTAYEEDE